MQYNFCRAYKSLIFLKISECMTKLWPFQFLCVVFVQVIKVRMQMWIHNTNVDTDADTDVDADRSKSALIVHPMTCKIGKFFWLNLSVYTLIQLHNCCFCSTLLILYFVRFPPVVDKLTMFMFISVSSIKVSVLSPHIMTLQNWFYIHHETALGLTKTCWKKPFLSAPLVLYLASNLL